jgi:hypothetical protein
MSVDFKIQNLCDHYINWERLNLLNDHRSINPFYPIGSVFSLSLRINNVVISPSNYSIYLNKDQMVLSPNSIITLNVPCRLYYPIVEAKYTTIPNYCPKCAGTLYIDDFIYGPNKDVVVTKDEFLLIQTLEKLIVTRLNSNKYYAWLGTTIHDLIGRKITDMDYIRTKIVEDVKKSVNDLKKIQEQYISSGRSTTKGELFGNLLGVDVTQLSDPTTIEILVKFTAQSGKSMELQQLVELSQLRKR